MEKHKLNIFPEMQSEDFNRLRYDLEHKGYDQKHPIYLYEDKILDGWNRYLACEELGIPVVYEIFDGSETEALDFVMRTNKRRNLTSSQWAAIAVEADEIGQAIREIVERDKRAKMVGNDNASKAKTTEQLIEPLLKDNTALTNHKLATTFNTNRTYVSEAAKIKVENPSLFEQVKIGEVTMSRAIQETKRTEVIAKLESIEAKEAKVISGKYDTIVIDPPWDMEKIERDVRPNQVGFDYPPMSESELEKLPIPAADNCHVWIWTTQRFLPMALRLIEKWGMKYVCGFVWHKDGGFQPFGLPQNNCEFAIYARIGTPEFTETKNLMLCFNAKRTGHSKKPDEFYDMVKRVTAGRRLDMFGRRQIDGFDCWGKEAGDSESAVA